MWPLVSWPQQPPPPQICPDGPHSCTLVTPEDRDRGSSEILPLLIVRSVCVCVCVCAVLIAGEGESVCVWRTDSWRERECVCVAY